MTKNSDKINSDSNSDLNFSGPSKSENPNGKWNRELILWRRGQVAELCSKGYKVMEIAKEVQVSHGTIINNIRHITEQSKQNLNDLIEIKLPKEFELTIIGLTSILRESWDAAQVATNSREIMSALALAKECYSLKLDMLTNASAINEAIDFVKKKKQWREAEQKADEVKAKSGRESPAEQTQNEELESEENEDPEAQF
jgi:hypothetical protein